MNRSQQAVRLAAHLSDLTDTEVTLTHDNGPRWTMDWTDGPTRDQMHAHLDAALAGYRYVDMRDRKIDSVRSHSEQAWAARAIASRREGALAPAIADGAAYRRALGVQLPRLGSQDPGETHDYYALLRHIGDLIDATPYPDRPSAPEDAVLIEELLTAGSRALPHGGRTVVSEYAMARALLAAEQAPTGDQPPRLRSV